MNCKLEYGCWKRKEKKGQRKLENKQKEKHQRETDTDTNPKQIRYSSCNITLETEKGIRAVCQKRLCRKKCRTASKCQRQFADSRFTKKHELTCFRQIAQKTLDVSK